MIRTRKNRPRRRKRRRRGGKKSRRRTNLAWRDDTYGSCWKSIGTRKNYIDEELIGEDKWKEDRPVSIQRGQTTSQPTLIANMVQLLFKHLHQSSNLRVLDIGSGSGIVTALFGCLLGKGNHIIGIDKFNELIEQSRKNIEKITERERKQFATMEFKTMDVYKLLKKPNIFKKKFNIIYVGAEPKTDENIRIFKEGIPKLLKKGGVAIAPISGELWIWTSGRGWENTGYYTRFVPLES